MSVKRLRFAYPGTRPPSGLYSFTFGNEVISSKSRFEITKQVRELLIRYGADVPADPFVLVMEQMCSNGSVPSDFCLGEGSSGSRSINLTEVKNNTVGICRTGHIVSQADDIMRRSEVCSRCPSHVKSGFCSTCTGVLTWFYGIIGGRRPKMPCDKSLGICASCMSLAVAVISFDDANPGSARPESCWKKKE